MKLSAILRSLRRYFLLKGDHESLQHVHDLMSRAGDEVVPLGSEDPPENEGGDPPPPMPPDTQG